MRILYIIFILIQCGETDMGLQRIDYKHILTWLITLNNAVGPTTSMTLRTLDNASPDDSNAIWLAPNGSDAAAGTQAAPVLTLEKAIDLLQAGAPTVTTIQIFRNSYVGDMEFSAVDDHFTSDTFPDDSIVQVELGETATIIFEQQGSILSTIWEGTGLKLNGLYIHDVNTTQHSWLIHFSSINTQTKWCSFTKTSDANLAIAFTRVRGGSLIKDCILDGNIDTPDSIQSSFLVDWNGGEASNCIMKNSSKDGIRVRTFTSSHNLFFNLKNGALIEGTQPVTIKNSIFAKIANNAVDDQSTATVVINNNFSDKSDSTLTGTDNQMGILPLFFDQLNEDFRLMDERRTAPNSTENFAFTSLAVYNVDIGQTPSDDSRDLGPYDVSYAADIDTWISFEMDNEFWNGDVTIDHRLTNYHSYDDVRGNFRRSFDGRKRAGLFTTKSNNFTGNVDSYAIADLVGSEGSKRYYPQGDDGIWSSSGALVENADGDFDVTLSSISNLSRNAYMGFIATVASGALEFELQIKSNASGSLVLTDHRDNQAGVVDDTYNVICSYLPIEVDQQSTPQVFSDWSAGLNPLRETATDTYEQQEGSIRTLRLRETEEDE